jgi:DNA-binding CsgD family transcriptional regulator
VQHLAQRKGGELSDIRQITEWNASSTTGVVYERLLRALGTEEFGATVREAVLSLTAGARRIYLFEATSRHDNSLQYFCGEPGLADLFPAYRKLYLRQDPVCDAYRATPKCSDVAIQRVRPSHITSPGFRRQIFDEPGIIERISIIQRGDDAWRVMNVARHVSDGCFNDQEIGALIGLACLTLPMLPLNRRHQAESRPLSVAQFEQRFERRFDSLTLRERQVCARAVAGMSVAATAQELQIATTSVLTYRRRAYQRLQVASPLELCALVTH